MFFHTIEEKQAAQVFGITNALGVTLINRDHPFPLLVEEEERVHGALLANTTHGALFRTLDCISNVPNMPFALAFVHRDTTELPSAQAVLNTLQFLRDQMALDTVQCHEGFAKHIAYAFQLQRVKAAERPALEERLTKDRKAYWLLDALCQRFVDPAKEGAHDLASSLGYLAAKAVLNTKDLLEILTSANAMELWKRFQTGRFASDLEARAGVAVKALEDCISGNWTIAERARARSAQSTDIYGIVADRLRAVGFETLDLKEPLWLISQTALLGKRIEALAEGIYCSEMAPFLGWTYGGDRQIEIDRRYLSETGEIQVFDIYATWRSVLSSDPALQVFYPPNECGAGWTIGDTDALVEAGWDKLAIYVTPAFEETGEPARRRSSDVRPATPRVHLYCFGLTREGPKSVIVPYANWWDEQEKFAEFPDNSLVFVALEPFIQGPTMSMAPVEELAAYLGNHAPVVYWRKVADPEMLTDETAVAYDPKADRQTGWLPDRGQCAVINRRRNHTTLTCVPKYVIKTVQNATRRFLDRDALRGRAARMLQPIDDREAWGMGAKLAYDLMYEHAILPEPLPYFSGLDLFHFLNSDV